MSNRIHRTYEFGDPAQGRIVDPNSFDLIRPARYAVGTVNAIYPNDPRVVGIDRGNGETCTIRVAR